MQNNKLAEIQQKYAGCNLLMPAATEVQLNPFYKVTVMEVLADLSENSGDVFKVGSVKSGEKTRDGKDIWVDTYSPAKPLLMKIAAAAGIQFDPDHTFSTRIDYNTYKAKAYGAMRMPDGTGKTHADEKTICLDDEEANYRIEFFDKSVKGIVDEKAAKAAAEMFKGHWIDSVNKWNKPCKAYVIDDSDRDKYIDRSVLVNMTLLRKTAAEKAMTGAILRVIRALTGLKGQYTRSELSKPFAIPRTSFSPDYNDPDVRRAMLSQGLNSVGSLFGSTPMAAIESDIPKLSTDMFNPEEFADNPAFSSDGTETEPTQSVEQPEERNWFDQDPPQQNASNNVAEPQEQAPQLVCEECGREISENVYEYSINKFGRPMCVSCQRGSGK